RPSCPLLLRLLFLLLIFFSMPSAPTLIYTLSLHDALPISIDHHLDVPDGSITVIIGRSGGGKSVFLKHLLGLLRPDSGEVIINGDRQSTRLNSSHGSTSYTGYFM